MNQLILINTDKLKILKVAGSIRCLEIWAEILAPHDDFRIDGVLGSSFSCFSLMELKMLWRNTQGSELQTEDYHRAITTVSELAQRMEIDKTSESELLAKLGKPMPDISHKPAPERQSRAATGCRNPSEANALPNRPKPGTATARVWEIADEISNQGDWQADWNRFRHYVIGRCVAAGINQATAQVQIGKWRKWQKLN